MEANGCDQLTEAQRECLRLVLTHHNSKEIAARLGVSPSAVDKRIERAVQMLGAPSRFAAARTLATFEGAAQGTYERLPCDLIDVPEAVDATPEAVGDGPWWVVRRLLGISPSAGAGGTIRNRLSRHQRLGLIAALAMVVAISTVALLNMGQTLSRLLAERGIASSR